MAQQTDANDSTERKELADKHEGASVTRERLQGTFEYEVTLTDSQINELPDRMTPEDFAENIATSRFNKELDPTFTVDPSDALAKEETDWTMNDERRFTVFVRFEKND